MGGPVRYYCNNHFVWRPKYENYRLEFLCEEDIFIEQYPQLEIETFSAPDVIFTYANGNNSRNEFIRLSRDFFIEVNLLEKQHIETYTKYTYKFKSLEAKCISYGDPDMEVNIPFGKLANMNLEEVKQYKARNFVNWKWGK